VRVIRMTLSKINKPNVFCLGMPKCGTTSLYNYLSQHPDVFVSSKKELHYFSRDEIMDKMYGPGDSYILDGCPKTLDEYLNCFNCKDTHRVLLDVSPSYMTNIKSLHKIKNFVDGAKLIIILRNPVDKVFSQYAHLVREGREKESFHDALCLEHERESLGYSDMWLYKKGGFYSTYVCELLSIFDSNNVMIVFQEDLLSRTSDTLIKICSFLNIERFNFDVDMEFNRSGKPKFRIISKLISPGPFLRFLKFFIPKSAGGVIKSFVQNVNTGDRIELSLKIRDKLVEFYNEDVKLLEEIIGYRPPWKDFYK
jgi:hypothetical protein